MKSPDEIYGDIARKPFSLKEFLKRHQIGLLGTLAFHMIILIVFLLMKIQDYKEISSLDLVFDFQEEPSPEELAKQQEEKERAEYYERLLNQQLNAGNQAVNIDKLEEEISTQKYVEDFMKQLNEQKSDEDKLSEDVLDDILNMDDLTLETVKPEQDTEKEEFRGPTNITYAFLDEPKNRVSVNIPVPVYKCQGFGEVEVLVHVNRLGNVVYAKPTVLEASEDPGCLSEVAERYARRAVFRGDPNAPAEHRARITYRFIAQ